MKKLFLALTLATAAVGASAHPKPYTHYHDWNNNGQVVIGNTFRPQVEVTTETDRYGREVRVTSTTTCVDSRRNRRNNHLRCLEEETTVERVLVERPRQSPVIEPRVQRFIERDESGRRVIVTVTDTCVRPGYQRGEAVCYQWQRDIDREVVRRYPHDDSLDLNGDGRTDAWERLLFQKFREVLEN